MKVRMMFRASLLFGAFVLAQPAYASFHLMQIEQVIGGVDGDTTAQAIQLRMRVLGQNEVLGARMRAWDATGSNPVIIIDFLSNVPNGLVGSRVLITSTNFNSLTTPTAVPNFTMTNLIPASYLAAGSLTFEDNAGTAIYWRLSWGGDNYTGPTTGTTFNDADGEFGKLDCPLPTGYAHAIRFTGTASAMSTTNDADYALTTGAARFNNNAGTLFTVQTPVCSTCEGDVDGDNDVDGDDLQAFVDCSICINNEGGSCTCVDMNGDTRVDQTDVALMVDKLLTDPDPACP